MAKEEIKKQDKETGKKSEEKPAEKEDKKDLPTKEKEEANPEEIEETLENFVSAPDTGSFNIEELMLKSDETPTRIEDTVADAPTTKKEEEEKPQYIPNLYHGSERLYSDRTDDGAPGIRTVAMSEITNRQTNPLIPTGMVRMNYPEEGGQRDHHNEMYETKRIEEITQDNRPANLQPENLRKYRHAA